MEGAVAPPPRQRRGTKKGSTATAAGKTISDLPNDIICDILSRLPLKSIISCRRVCKTWRNQLLEPYFAGLHLSRSPLSLILYRRSRKNASRFGVLELDDPARLHRRNATLKFSTEIQIPNSRIEIVGSCNGLICLSDRRSGDTVIVCNPIKGLYFILPKPPIMAAKEYSTGYGFGYSPSTDQYKVFRFTKIYNPSSRLDYCEIYTLGNDEDDAWRSIGDSGQPSPLNLHGFVYLNGALHWIVLGDPLLICYFDIEKEQFGNFPLPSYVGPRAMHIGVVENCLYICDDCLFPSINIWVMKEYGHIESLILEWVVERPFPHRLIGPVKPIKILKDGTLLIIFNRKTLASYNPETRVLEKITYHGVRFWDESVADVPSFLSPVNALR